MITKTILATGVAAAVLLAVAPFAFAEDNGQTRLSTTTEAMKAANKAARVAANAADVATKIACVGAAVNIREAALGSAIATHAAAESAAYAARAAALNAAYSQATTTSGIRTAVNAAWNTFNASMKTAQRTWKAASNAAWLAYRTPAVGCNAPEGTGDGNKSGFEISGR